MNVILVGYRGTGKSSVARLVARSLGYEVVNLDAEIVEKAGQAIPEIVADRGWEGFRDLEEEVCREAAGGDGRVLDCGGGVVERDANVGLLRSAGKVFWLTATPESIVARIAGDDQRPSLTGTKSFTEEVAEVLERRTPLYRKLAHVEVTTDGRTVDDVAAEIVSRVRTEPG